MAGELAEYLCGIDYRHLDQGSSWCPLHCSILTTEPPGKPILLLLKKIYAYGQRLNNQYKVYEVKLVEDEWFFLTFLLILLLCYNICTPENKW